jgi:hypothetical protein
MRVRNVAGLFLSGLVLAALGCGGGGGGGSQGSGPGVTAGTGTTPTTGTTPATDTTPATGTTPTTTSGSVGTSTPDPNAPAGLTLTSGAPQGITGGLPVLISANVTRAAGGPVPDGTAVTFAITSGAGTLTGAGATSGGIATVSLASSSAGASVTVSATVGSLAQTVSVPFVSQPTQAIVKVRTVGTLPAAILIGGISATVTYSGGKGLSIASDPAHIALSGVGSGALIPNTNASGQVVLGLINLSGMPAGEFATLTFAIAAGNFPSAADFSVSSSGLSVIDTATLTIPGMGVAIASAIIQ